MREASDRDCLKSQLKYDVCALQRMSVEADLCHLCLAVLVCKTCVDLLLQRLLIKAGLCGFTAAAVTCDAVAAELESSWPASVL